MRPRARPLDRTGCARVRLIRQPRRPTARAGGRSHRPSDRTAPTADCRSEQSRSQAIRSSGHDGRLPDRAVAVAVTTATAQSGARAQTAAWASAMLHKAVRPSSSLTFFLLSHFFSLLSNSLWSGLEVALAGKIYPLASYLWKKKNNTLGGEVLEFFQVFLKT